TVVEAEAVSATFVAAVVESTASVAAELSTCVDSIDAVSAAVTAEVCSATSCARTCVLIPNDPNAINKVVIQTRTVLKLVCFLQLIFLYKRLFRNNQKILNSTNH